MAEKILIIDDDLDTLRLVGLILERHGYEITTANRGLLGLKKAVEEHPDLIVLDIMMPEMDGYDVARRLRENKLTAKIPILMFTAKTQMDDKVAGFDAGADGYITKPTHPSELKSNVMTLLARAGHQADDSEAAVPLTRGFVIAVLSASGGAGVSSLAINLGTSLFNQTHADVVLAEFTPGRGSLALDLGLGNGKEAGLTIILSASPEDISEAEKLISLGVDHIGSVIKTIATLSAPVAPSCGSKENLYNRVLALEKKIDSLAQRIEQLAKSSP